MKRYITEIEIKDENIQLCIACIDIIMSCGSKSFMKKNIFQILSKYN